MMIKGHHISPVFTVSLVVVLLAAGFAAYSMNKSEGVQEEDQQTTAQSSSTSTATPSASASASSTSNQLVWMQSESGWKSSGTLPTDCPAVLPLTAPADLSKVTGILYPGQTRGGNYKPHGGFRFDTITDNAVTVTAPIDGFIVRGGQYLAEGEIQYTFDVMNNCGVMYRVGHFREIPDSFMELTKSWPAAVEGDSRTNQVNPPVFVAKGTVIATKVGIIKDANTFFDWGVYDYRSQNEASASTSFQQAHSADKELSWHAVCWFDWLSAADEATVRSLPAGDPTSAKKSDYCK